MDAQVVRSMILAVGGLGLLLFGIKMLSTGLEVVAGDKLQVILKKSTSNRFLAAVVGIFATIVINSSTAVSIIVVGFVNAGLMNLQQAIGVMMGINVGTTFSAQLVAFRIDQYAPLFILLGVILHMFFKKRIVKNIGYAVLGFGILFFSVTVMSDALRIFRELPAFQDAVIAISNPLMALLVGFLFTILIQSSSATMAILVTLNLQVCYCCEGYPAFYIPFLTSAFIIFGANIGTSTTALLAALPASRDSKRTALFHITYSFIGAMIFGALILAIPAILGWFQVTWVEPARQVAMFHTLFNIATLVVLIPFVTPLARLMQIVFPVLENETKKTYERELMFLSENTMKTPTAAVMNAHQEVCRAWEIANENFDLALESLFELDTDKAARVLENEKTIDFLHQNITPLLAKVTSLQLSKTDTRRIGDMFVVLSEIEQIGDRAENIAEYVIEIKDSGLSFSDVSREELANVSKLTRKIMALALEAYTKQKRKLLPEIETLEDEIDEMVAVFAQNHYRRLRDGKCKSKMGVMFTDTLSDLEKCADSSEKIAFLMED